MKKILLIAAAAILLSSCLNKNKPQAGDPAGQPAQDNPDAVVWNGYRNVEPALMEGNIIEMLASDWMLITSGDESSFNTMTASWGGLGRIWEMPVSFSFVRNTRYTYEFMKENDYYTLSFFPAQYKQALQLLGSKSGRDTDKVTEAGLTPVATPSGSMSFEEAAIIIECRKLLEQALDPRSMFDDRVAADYISKPAERHIQFIGEIVNVWVK